MAMRLVTGANGCIGAWVVRRLLEIGDDVTALDQGTETHRLKALLDPESLARVRFVQADVSDAPMVRTMIESYGVDGVIHLAGLQVPTCRTDPMLGATVNVLGTLAVFEAAAAVGCRVIYASSAAVYGPDDEPLRPHGESEAGDTRTHYGIFKLANEGNARIYHQDQGVNSVGLRPLTVYGVGRDFGMTSGPTTALKAAILGQPYTIGFQGPTDFQLAEDIAEILVRCFDAPEGAHVFNPHGETSTVEKVIEIIDSILPESRRGLIDCDGPHLPIPGALDDSALAAAIGPPPRTSLRDGLAATYAAFSALHSSGSLDLRDLPEEVTS
ncbi:MAG: NAD(P)-dependent oxidoreductase [Phycisphaerales bacterium]|nr:NAD(P)-dependent oxidoreductase [Phycisphaerales bacterium]